MNEAVGVGIAGSRLSPFIGITATLFQQEIHFINLYPQECIRRKAKPKDLDMLRYPGTTDESGAVRNPSIN